jgi:hypothetical protein
MGGVMSILDKRYIVTMEDQSQWAVPVKVIAMNRAAYYAERDFEGNLDRSLQEDTLPLFEANEYEIENWAKNNMSWSDVVDFATQIKAPEIDFEDGWLNGSASVY